MTRKQFDRMVERLSEQHGLSMQLTAAWLRDRGFSEWSILSEQDIVALCNFARE